MRKIKSASILIALSSVTLFSCGVHKTENVDKKTVVTDEQAKGNQGTSSNKLGGKVVRPSQNVVSKKAVKNPANLKGTTNEKL